MGLLLQPIAALLRALYTLPYFCTVLYHLKLAIVLQVRCLGASKCDRVTQTLRQ